MCARWYDPVTGRFLQRDPMDISATANVCEYVWNSPTTFADPKGLWPRAAEETHAEYRGWRKAGRSPSQASAIMQGGRGTGAPTAEELAVFCVFVTGGESSWLDNPATVRKAQKTAVAVASIAGAGALPVNTGLRCAIAAIAATINIWAWYKGGRT